MRPRIDEILTSVIETLDRYVRPEVTDAYARSMTVVVSGLLGQVNLRLEHEGQALADRLAEDRAALAAVLELLETTGAGLPTAAQHARAIRGALDKRFRPANAYPTLRSLAVEVTEIGLVLEAAHRMLLGAEGQLGTDPAFRKVREMVRSHAGAQLEREAVWAFGAPIDTGRE